jgi:hypothetical protein
LINAIAIEYRDEAGHNSVAHLFCIWHINNNVLINCKKDFDTKKAWDEFFAAWKSVMYASSVVKYIAA